MRQIYWARQRASASAAAKATKTLEMDPESYLSAYDLAAGRHGMRHAFSAESPAMRATGFPHSSSFSTSAAAKTAKSATDMSLSRAAFGLLFVILNASFTAIKYAWSYTILPALILWFLYGVVNWRQWIIEIARWWQQFGEDLAEIVADGGRVFFPWLLDLLRRLSQHLELCERFVAFANATLPLLIGVKETIQRFVNNLRFNWLTDTIYLYYQRTIIWIGNHKPHLIVIVAAIYFISARVEASNDDIDRFMSWPELQRYLDKRIPDVLLRPPKEYGSNSHYQRESYETIG